MNVYEASGTALLCLAAVCLISGIAARVLKNRLAHSGRVIVCACALFSAAYIAAATLFAFSGGTRAAHTVAGHVLMGASGAIFFVGLFTALAARKNRLWVFAAFVLFTVLMHQISLSVACPYDLGAFIEAGGNSAGLVASPWYALVARTLANMFQMFSLDAGYAEMAEAGALAFAGYGSGVFIGTHLSISVIAPATGGFAVFGLLCHFFPVIALFFKGFRRVKFVFSELNEYSVTTAESICAEKRRLKGVARTRAERDVMSSVMIFTDAYADSDAENSAELLDRAKKAGAICLRTDLSEFNLRWLNIFSRSKKAVYFLIDRKEENNLKAAVSLLTPGSLMQRWAKLPEGGAGARIKNAFRAGSLEMYVFTSNTEADGALENAYKNLCPDEKNSDGQEYDITYKVVNECKNLVYRLIDGYAPAAQEGGQDKYPLYWSLLPEKEGGPVRTDRLRVVILGGGRIGREFFKAAYWCGQMLDTTAGAAERCAAERNPYRPFPSTKLGITVLTVGAEEMRAALAFDMPDVDMNGTGDCAMKFIEADYGTSGSGLFREKFRENCLDADYFLVALGNDTLNMQAAGWIKREVDMFNASGERAVPVNYVIENGDMCAALRGTDKVAGSGCILNAFGSLPARYSYENICMSDFEGRGYSVNCAHSSAPVGMSEFIRDYYGRQSSVASAMHFPYKLVSLGVLRERRLWSDEDLKRLMLSRGGRRPEYLAFGTDEYVRRIYWLEHKRWMAYVRTVGMYCPTANEFFQLSFREGAFDKKMYSANKKAYKFHPCLVEAGRCIEAKSSLCAQYGTSAQAIISDCAECIRALRSRGAQPVELARWLNDNVLPDAVGLDPLDRLSLISDNDFKEFDVNVVRKLFCDEAVNLILGFTACGFGACGDKGAGKDCGEENLCGAGNGGADGAVCSGADGARGGIAELLNEFGTFALREEDVAETENLMFRRLMVRDGFSVVTVQLKAHAAGAEEAFGRTVRAAVKRFNPSSAYNIFGGSMAIMAEPARAVLYLPFEEGGQSSGRGQKFAYSENLCNAGSILRFVELFAKFSCKNEVMLTVSKM